MDISLIKAEQTEAAKQIVLQGFKERFGFIIEGLNPDLDDIQGFYHGDKYFYVGKMQEKLIATGGIIFETHDECRIVRMSVLAAYRNHGLGREMLLFLEKEASAKMAASMILETNKGWKDAVAFYVKNGYRPYHTDDDRIHFRKKLHP